MTIGSMAIHDEGPDGVYGPAGPPARALTEEEVKQALSREIEDSFGGLGSKIEEQRRLSIRYYQGKPIGTEIKGRSQVVSLDVLESIQWAMPSLMRMFTGGTRVVRFTPRPTNNPEETAKREQDAKDATEYINHIFEQQLDGYALMYDWMFTALLEKNGIAKAWWEERRYPEVQHFTGMTEEEVMSKLDEPDTDAISMDESSETIDGQELKVFDLVVRKWTIEKGIRAAAIPPEEFQIARRTIKLNDETMFSAHIKRVTVSELVSMGFPFDQIAELHSDDTPEYAQARVERLSEDETAPTTYQSRNDAASRELWVTEAWIRIDEDGDGYSELRRILAVGHNALTILEDEEVAFNPFSSICPIPMAHKFFGNSLADLVMDIQAIRTTLLRQILDHIYLSVNPRLQVVEGKVEYEDLMSVTPGGLVRVQDLESIAGLELPPLPREAGELFAKFEEIRGNRTGVIAHGTEIDASAINTTATGLGQLMAEKAQKLEMIGRIFAQTGFRDFFGKLLRITVENNSKEEQFYVNGRWLTIDPARWDKGMNCEIQVGLGAGAAVERIASIEKLMAIQKQVIEGGGYGQLVTKQNIYHAAAALTDACGFKHTDLFFTDPEGKPDPPEKPNPEIEKIRLEAMKMQQEAEHNTSELEFETVKQTQLDEFRFADLAQKKELELERMRTETIKSAISVEGQLEVAEIQMREHTEIAEENREASIRTAEISARGRDRAEKASSNTKETKDDE